MLHAQVEAGSLCPDNDDLCRHAIVVTDVTCAVSGLTTPLLSDRYDSHLLAAWAKTWLVDRHGNDGKAGGSDVASNTTCAERLDDGSYRLVGINGKPGAAKRCASGAGTDRGRFVLLFVPRFLPDGQRTRFASSG